MKACKFTLKTDREYHSKPYEKGKAAKDVQDKGTEGKKAFFLIAQTATFSSNPEAPFPSTSTFTVVG